MRPPAPMTAILVSPISPSDRSSSRPYINHGASAKGPVVYSRRSSGNLNQVMRQFCHGACRAEGRLGLHRTQEIGRGSRRPKPP